MFEITNEYIQLTCVVAMVELIGTAHKSCLSQALNPELHTYVVEDKL